MIITRLLHSRWSILQNAAPVVQACLPGVPPAWSWPRGRFGTFQWKILTLQRWTSPKTHTTHQANMPWNGHPIETSFFFATLAGARRSALKVSPETSQGSKILVMFRCNFFLAWFISDDRCWWQFWGEKPVTINQRSFHKEESTTTIQQHRPVGHVKSL